LTFAIWEKSRVSLLSVSPLSKNAVAINLALFVRFKLEPACEK
jgi:hypothetical protein